MESHSNSTEMERFCARTLDVPRMIAVGVHLADCAQCHGLYHEIFQRKRNYAPVAIDLAAENWLKDEHLDYEWLTAYVDDSLEPDAREMTELHLRLCQLCREDMAAFIAWQKDSAAELKIRYAPEPRAAVAEKIAWWSWFDLIRRPAYAFALLFAVGFVIFTVLSFLQPGSGSEEKQPTLATASPVASPTVSPTSKIASASPTGPQISAQNNPHEQIATSTKPVISLRDRSNQVTINDAGEMSGLVKLPEEMRQSIKEFLLLKEAKPPDVLAQLATDKSALRGKSNQSAFKLFAPLSSVIVKNQPVFRWEHAKDVTAWRVYVSDARSRKVADSGELPATQTQWTPAVPLKRGELYTWSIGAMVNGEEVIAPSASEPEARFLVIAEKQYRVLQQLKQTTDSHLALGVHYARIGLLADAEREFQQLVNSNPDSTTARQLLSLIKSWQ